MPERTKIACTVGILTFNSGAMLERCLESVKDFDEIIIADGGSTDDTLEIARRYGCRIIPQSNSGHPITDFSLEKNRLLDAASHDWFLCLDSDEFISAELQDEIRVVCTREAPEHYAYRVPWLVTNADTSITYIPFKTYYQYRFFNKKSGGRFARKVHERVEFDEKKFSPGTFKGVWYVPLYEERDFAVYRAKIKQRVAVMAQERVPRNFIEYLRRIFFDTGKNLATQLIKFSYLHARYSSRRLPPIRYELYKLYQQGEFVRMYTYLYTERIRRTWHGALKICTYSVAYAIRTTVRIFTQEPEVLVLMYHSVGASAWKHSVSIPTFERQMRYLDYKYHVVPLSDIVAHAKGEKSLPHRSVALTFDDGYRDVFLQALPILERYQIPATLFVTTDLAAKTGSNECERISWDELRAAEATGLISIESHGHSHRPLSRISEEEIKEELADSATFIEREIGKRPRFFAYPFGARSSIAERMVKDVYEAGFSITGGLIRPGDDIARLKRVQVDQTMNFTLFRLRLTGAVEWSRRITDWFR